MNTKQFLSDILDEFNKIDYVKPEDIPNIDLYMDHLWIPSLPHPSGMRMIRF